MRKLFIRFIVVGLIVMAVAGCGKEAATTAPATQTPATAQPFTSTPVPATRQTGIKVKDFANRELVFDKAPQTFATLSSGDMEIIHKLGGKIVGRPTSKAPLPSEELKAATEIGTAHQVSIEKIVSIKPDVLIASAGIEKDRKNIEAQGIKIFVAGANSIQDIQKSIDVYGTLLNKSDQAKALNKQISDKVSSYDKAAGKKVRALLVYGAPGTYMVALPNSLTGDILAKAGGENVAADYPKATDFPQYATLSVERIIESKPDIVYLITHADPEAVKKAFEEEMAKNAAWKNLDAVKAGRVVILPANLFGANPGTKITEAIDFMATSLQKVTK
ncbi:ABC transporter substrate-binding protein [Paenibacillus radicibacter]|uniref:ABC transporter substrate-binding protein n=1 Tax=Paenibacillus radicibacter TaxID=2972488 RepID=UPI00280AE05E|nr:ABC transporter substrate-binding protein [Paenibacillus radicibacter]